jgi:2-aminoadipate transaminase
LDSSGGVNPYTGLVVAALCEAGDFDPHVAHLRQAYRSRRDALVGALQRNLPDTFRWRTPGGGFFLWIDLPPDVDAETLLPVAEASGTSFFPGVRFHTDGGGQRNLRLVFTLYPETKLVEAAERLGRAVSSLPASP